MFARFSRPTARVLFSRVAIIGTFDGQPMLMFRAANKRGNQILEARLWVTLVQDQQTSDGQLMRRIYDLNLVRNHTPSFFLTWLALHPLDADSPLFEATLESMAAKDSLIFVNLTGIDETVTQTVHARHAYTVKDIMWNHRFVDVFSTLPDGRRVLDYTYFHDVELLEP
jgi:inward rectifier potassium channel